MAFLSLEIRDTFTIILGECEIIAEITDKQG